MKIPYVYRNYTYLDGSVLNTIAEDIDMDVKLSYEVVERTTKDKGGKAGFGARGFTAGGELSSKSERQETYSLSKDGKSTSTKIIKHLVSKDMVFTHDMFQNEEQPIDKGSLVELEGSALITAASSIGRLMHAFHPVIKRTKSLMELQNLGMSSKDIDKVVSKYLIAEDLPNINLLYKMSVPDIPPKNILSVYLNFKPGNFLDTQESVNMEDQFTVFGVVKLLVPGNGNGKGTDAWIMPGFNDILRKTVLAGGIPDSLIKNPLIIEKTSDTDHPEYIKGPAMIVDVIAMY